MELKLYFGVRQQMRFGRDGRFSHYRVRGFYCSAEAAPAQTVTADGRHVVVVNFFATKEAADAHKDRCIKNAVSYSAQERADEKEQRGRKNEIQKS